MICRYRCSVKLEVYVNKLITSKINNTSFKAYLLIYRLVLRSGAVATTYVTWNLTNPILGTPFSIKRFYTSITKHIFLLCFSRYVNIHFPIKTVCFNVFYKLHHKKIKIDLWICPYHNNKAYTLCLLRNLWLFEKHSNTFF